MEKIKKLLNLQPGEGGIVFVLGFALLANALAMQVSGIVSISGFLNSSGANGILIVLLVDYAFILLTGALQTLVIDKFERTKLIQWITLLFAFLFVLLRMMFVFNSPEWLNYSFMYILSEQQFILFPLVFWVLANDIFKIAQAKRLFPIISGFNFVGKLIGIGISLVSPGLFPKIGIQPEEILTLNVLVYLLAFMVLWGGLSKVKVRKTVVQTETLSETLREGWKFLLDVPSFKFMMFTIIALAVADTLIEFQFLTVTDSAFPDQASYQRFFSAYRLGITLVSLVVQAFVTGYLIKQMQLKNTFLFFPAVALIGVVGMIFVPGIGVAIAAMAGVKLIRDTINESGRKSFQGLVPEERRGRVSTLMESYLPAIGTMLACILGIIVIYIGGLLGIDSILVYIYMGIAAIGAIVALWAVLKMRNVYDSSLLNWRLKRRQRRTQTALLDKLGD
jgi:AAA family ATP:ADP antiporter